MPDKHYSLASCAAAGQKFTDFYNQAIADNTLWTTGLSVRQIRLKKLEAKLKQYIILVVFYDEQQTCDLYLTDSTNADTIRTLLSQSSDLWPHLNSKNIEFQTSYVRIKNTHKLPNECIWLLKRLDHSISKAEH